MANYQQPTNFQLNPSYVELEDLPRAQSPPHGDDEEFLNPKNGTSYSASTYKAEGADHSSEKIGFWRAVRKHPWVFIYCFVIAIVAGALGFQGSTLGAVTGGEKFTEDYGDTDKDGEKYLSSVWLSIWQAVPPICGAFGCILGGWVQDRIGRKFTLMGVGIFNAVSVAFLVFSHALPALNSRRGILTVGMGIQGLANSGLQVVAFTYVSEISTESMRDGNMVMMPLCSLLGQFVGSAFMGVATKLDGKNKYIVPFAVGWIVGVVTVPLSLIIPDSAVFLVRSGQEARAIRTIQRLLSKKVNAYIELDKIRHAVDEERMVTKDATYISCFKGINLRRTLIVVLVSAFPAILGLDILSNAPVFLATIGIESETTRVTFMAVGIIIAIVCLGVGTWIGTIVGLRRATVVSLVFAAIAWTVMGVSGFFGGGAAPWIGAVSLYGTLISGGLGCWPASFAYMGSLSSLQLRALTQGLSGVASSAASALMSAVLPQLFREDAANLGAKVGFVFTGTCLLGAGLSWLYLPEIKGRTVHELDKMFEARLPTRRFRGWNLADADVREEALPLATS
ncbi:unnamed protein product [Clonostachys rosea f. rosea IK726]|jgi:MFS family permease|uniref:Major facilitator superfamily (MFS) profile domain-containing protein n=2 Tax=Bionectria ochroleuca TaxID=29856 RepID=A0A8H7KA21_BIOOC|nr:unnamed protein product [Clonostachys rosea f. rosea IK726]